MDEDPLAEIRASMQTLLNPRFFLDYLEEVDVEIPDEVRKMVLEFPEMIPGGNEEIEKIIGKPPKRWNPLEMSGEDMERNLDVLWEHHVIGRVGGGGGGGGGGVVGGVDGVGKGKGKEVVVVDEKGKGREIFLAKKMAEDGEEEEEEEEMEGGEEEPDFLEKLRKHPLWDLLNSPSTGSGVVVPNIPIRKSKVEAKFQYEQLDWSTDASRLIVLHPGSRNDEIRCTLQPLPLSVIENPDDKSTEHACYEALSYVWGDPTSPQTIQINGHDFEVGSNLYSALLHLRLEEHDRLLWIDAICINQSDIPERNHQVSRMGLIYRAALQVIAWLGPATQGSDEILSVLLAFQIAQEGHSHLLTQNHKELCECLFGDDDLKADASLLKQYPGYLNMLWDQLDILISRPLFTRSWVVQEIVLGRHVSIHCGNSVVSYDTLLAAVGRALILRQSYEINIHVDLQPGLTQFKSFIMLRNELRTAQEEEELPLYHLAARFGRLQATDQRDKIYSFLGLSSHLIKTGKPHEQSDFEPDYSKPVLDVFRDFAIFCMKKYNNLYILTLPYRHDDSHPLESGWPSWVPDWERRGIREMDFVNIEAVGQKKLFRDFFAGSHEEEDIETVTLPDKEFLAIMGYDFDEVAEVVEGDIFTEASPVSGEKGVWTTWHNFATKLSSEYPVVYDDNEEAFWRTLVADSNGEGEIAPEEFGTMYRRWRAGSGLKHGASPGEWLPSPHYTDEETELFASFMNALQLATRGRKLFRTKRGYLGLGTWAMEPGYRIHILHRSSLPVVGSDTGGFQQLVDIEGKEVEGVRFPIYRLVGSGGVYIHGIMDGETMGIAEEEGLEVAPVWFA